MKRTFRWIALILTVALMVQMLPLGVWASEPVHEAVRVPVLSESVQEDVAYVIGEVRELREENQKHFRMSDGSFIAVSYGDSVHFSDADGAWQDIDNTLAASADGREYMTVNGTERRRFASQVEEGGFLLSVESGEYGMFLSAVLENTESTLSTSQFEELTVQKQAPIAIVSNPQEPLATLSVEEKRERPLAEQTAPTKLSSSVRYEDVWDETDLEYSVTGQNVKECIVIQAPREDYQYSFLLQLTELTPELNGDGSISLYNSQMEVIFSIPAPYMEDANGSFSSEAVYSLEEKENGEYLLTVTADAQWMNAEDRAFPVKLDPTIFKEGSTANKNIITSYVNSGRPNSASYENKRFIRCGYFTNTASDANCTGHTVGLIYIKEPPTLPNGSVPTQAYLNLVQTSYGVSANSNHPKIYTSTLNVATTDATIESYLNAITWNDFLSEITYGAPDANGERTALDYVKAMPTDDYEIYWNITSAVQTWYKEKDDPMPSISKLLVLDDGRGSTSNARATYAGYGYDASNALNLPQIIVEYRNMVGTESIYDYHTQSAGRAGVGYVNNFTLGLSFQVPLLSSPSETMPFSLSLIYNSQHSSTNFTATNDIHTESYTTSKAGHGWKTSVQQSIAPVNITGDYGANTKYLVYTDADGTEHYFAKKENSSTVYEDEDGMDLTITIYGSTTNPTYYTMKDKDNNTWTFYYGYLTSFMDYNGNSLYYAYNGVNYSTSSTTWQPSSSTATYRVTSVWRKNDGATSAEKIATLTYTENTGYLSSVTDQAGRKTTISIINNQLTQITFPDGKTATYTYTKDGGLDLLSEACDNEIGYKICYSYSMQLGQRRVFEITEEALDGSTWVAGNSMRAYKAEAVYSRFRYYGANRMPDTNDDLVSRFWFDNYGRTVNATTFNHDETEIFNVSASTYTKNEGTNKKNNRLLGAASSGALSPNLLYNSGAEYETTNLHGWSIAGSGSSAAREDSGSTPLVKPRTGKYLMKLYTQTTTTGTQTRYQSVSLTEGTTYVFSAYVNTACATSFATSGGAYLAVRNSSGEEQKSSRLVNYKTNAAIDAGWERIELVYTPEVSGTYQFAANIKHMAQIAVFDDFQLEAVVDTTLPETDDTEEEENGEELDAAASSVNLLQIGDFEARTTAISANGYTNFWTYNSNQAAPVSYTGRGKTMTFAPGIGNKHRATQTVNLNVPSNTTFLLSAWGQTPASSMNSEDDLTGDNSGNKRFFGIIATLTYTDSTPQEYFYIPFNDDVGGWQYICGTVVPKTENKTVASITVALACDYNANRTYIDDVRLVKEPVQTYAYDDEGKLLNTSDSENNKTSTEYDESDRMISYTGMDGVSYALNYTGENRDPATITSDGVETAYSYDAAGNITQTDVTNSTDSSFLQSKATYSTDKNYLTQTKDVNGAETNYRYYVTGNLSSNEKTTGLLKTLTNANNVITSYTYDADNDRSKTVTVDGSHVIAYEYDKGRLVGLSRNDTNTNARAWTWQRYKTYYNAFGQRIKITVGQVGDYEGFPYGSSSAEITLAEYSYAPNGGNLQRMTYGNGSYVNYSYDLLDRVIEETYYNSSNTCTRSVTYVYNPMGALAKRYTKNGSGTLTETHTFEYDSLGRLIRSSEFDGANNLIQRIEQLYDTANRLSSQSWVIEGDAYTESYTYRTSDGLLDMSYDAVGGNTAYTYDALKRLSGTTVKDQNNDTVLRTGYSYIAGEATNQTTARVNAYTVWNSGWAAIVSYRHVYDALGNITEIIDAANSNRTIAEYTYDDLNQLTQEIIYSYDANGNATATTCTYTYDSAGNIVSEITQVGTATATEVEYNYSSGPWADMLTATDDLAIAYEGQSYTIAGNVSGTPTSGNPIYYQNGTRCLNSDDPVLYLMQWSNGRQLTYLEVWDDTQTRIEYAYDADGIRTAKWIEGYKHAYVTQNGKVVRETIGSGTSAKVLNFIYDTSGRPFALIYKNGTASANTYYYVLNLQGDVVALTDASGAVVARYTYNAWGKLLSVTDANGDAITSTTHIANLNPIRYRGYYYDSETGFYYLQSRYYDPANHRFINADSIASTGQGFTGTNMFAYCNNNPVILLDMDGLAPDWWQWLVSGAMVVTGVVMVVTDVGGITGGTLICSGANSIVGSYTSEASGGSSEAGWVGGLFTGAIVGIGAGFSGTLFSKASATVGVQCICNLVAGSAAATVSGFVGSVAGQYVSAAIDGKKIDKESMLYTAVITAAVNIFAGIGSSMVSAIQTAPSYSTTTVVEANSLAVMCTLVVETFCDLMGTILGP